MKVKYYNFFILHQVKFADCQSFLYFAPRQIWNCLHCESQKCMSIFCNMQKSKVFKYHAFYIEHNAKNGICNHYERQISKVPYFEQCKI